MKIEKFKALPAAQKRVLIAKDVLARIKSKKYIVQKGTYVGSIIGDVSPNDDIRASFRKIKSCQVCALGACLMSTTKFANKLKFEDIKYERGGIDTMDNSWNILERIFSPSLMSEIESCFEASDYITLVGEKKFRGPGYSKYMYSYKDKFPDQEKRLIAIMRNLIRNKGTFVPKQDLK